MYFEWEVLFMPIDVARDAAVTSAAASAGIYDPDLCEREPIHLPGAIQPHGALIAARVETWLVTHASANIGLILGRPAKAVLGRSLEEVFGEAVACTLRDTGLSGGTARIKGLTLPGSHGSALRLEAYRSGPYLCVDIEPTRTPAARTPTIAATHTVVETFRHAATRQQLCSLAVRGLHELSGYDRVIAYRFAADGSGEVIAEAGMGALEPCLGHRFPATDIPAQARQLYLHRRVGAVADAAYEPVPLLVHSAFGEDEPLDLTQSTLRSVSPLHRAYMCNMQTMASLTIGLAHAGSLWGLLVCHHATPRIADPDLRMAAGLIGEVVSLLLGELSERELRDQRHVRDVLLRSLVDRMVDRSEVPTPLPQALTAGAADLLRLVDASGAVLRFDDSVYCLGITPPQAVAKQVLATLQSEAGGAILTVDDLGLRHTAFAEWTREASGALLLPLGPDAADAILWLRPELPHPVVWGGDPAHSVTCSPQTGQLHPRASFAAWKEIVRGRSVPWTEADLAVAGALGIAIGTEEALRTKAELARRVREQEAQNAALSRAAAALQASEDRLRASEARLDRAQEIAGIGSWELTVTTGRYIWSKEMFRIRGVDPTIFEPNSDNIGRYVHPEDYPKAMSRIADLAAGIGVPPAEMRILHPDGQLRVVRVEGRPVVDPDGVIRRITGTMQDITERRQIEQQLVHVQKMDALGNLTGGMAHDFNNMLGIIMVNLELLQGRVTSDPTSAELCLEALNGADRCADLIRRLLAFARRQSLHPKQTDVNDLVYDITHLLRRTLGEDIQLSLGLSPELWPVKVDAVQLESALVNLATNARDAMPKGGRLDFNTRNTRLDASYTSLYPDVAAGEYVLIEISDTGTGIPPDIIGRIFEPFFTTKGIAKGSGLGLSMAFGFVKQSGGHLSVYSEPGLGTTFRLYLPRGADNRMPHLAGPPIKEVVGGHEIVLIVEDHPLLRRAASRQLTELGYHVREAENADAALVILSSQGQLDLLFTDVVMPGTMDGLDLAIAAQKQRPDLKVLVTTGFAGMRDGEPRMAGSSFSVLDKPYNRAQLARAVRTLLGDDAA